MSLMRLLQLGAEQHLVHQDGPLSSAASCQVASNSSLIYLGHLHKPTVSPTPHAIGQRKSQGQSTV